MRVLTMLLVPLMGFAIASCGESAREPYAGTPEGVPPGLSASIPDPAEVTEVKPQGTLPDFLDKVLGPGKDRITGLYRGAMEHHNDFGYIPCYCGCAVYATPHESLSDCFIKDVASDGSMTFTNHSTSCDICEGVAKLTLDGLAGGKPLNDIRTEVFAAYKYTGIWTDTPPVP